jgi:hypothetical protein
MAPWAGAGVRWADRVAEAIGVLFATGTAQPDPSLDGWLLDLATDGDVLGATAGVARIQALVAALRAIRASDGAARFEAGGIAWGAAHGLLSWCDAWRRELDRAILRATLIRGDTPPEELAGTARRVTAVGALVAGSRWTIHARDADDRPVMVVDDLREPELPHDAFNSSAISRLWQERVVLAERWAGPVRFASSHPADESGGRILIRPAFHARPTRIEEPWEAPRSRQDGGPVRVRVEVARSGPDVVARYAGRGLVMSEIARWNLEKLVHASGEGEWFGWAVAGELLSLEIDGSLRWIGCDPRAVPAGWGVAADAPEREGLRAELGARLGGRFADAGAPGAFQRWFADSTRDPDPATAAARAIALRAANRTGAEEALAAGVGMVMAALRDDEAVPPDQILALEAAAGPADRPVADLPIPWLRRWVWKVDREGAVRVAQIAGFAAEL